MTPRRSLALLAATGLALTLGLSACSATDGTPADPTVRSDETTAPADVDLDALAALGAEDLVATLEATPVTDRRTDLLASVRPGEVLLSSGDQELRVPVPEGQHYLSIAPYVSGTHACFFHSLTTCVGELGGQEVTVQVVDDATGEVYVDETRTLEDNGFAGFWLPSDVTATVTVTAGDRTGSASVATGAEDLTCLTGLRLA